MIIFAAASRQLYNWCRMLKNVATTVKNKMVMGGYKCESDGVAYGTS